MSLSYQKDLLDFETFKKKSVFLQTLYNELSEKQTAFSSLLDIFESLFTILDLSSRDDYLKRYWNELCYEIVMDIYDTATNEYKLQFSPSLPMREYLTAYKNFFNNADYKTNWEESASKFKKSIFPVSELKKNSKDNDTSKIPSALQNSNKIGRSKQNCFYFEFWESFLPVDGENFKSLLEKQDVYPLLQFYNSSIYSEKNYNKGIQLHNFYKMIHDYLEISDNSLAPLTQEHRIYQFEQLYRPIQFSNCVTSFLQQDFSKEQIPSEYLPLFLYTKLFDTPYISLSKYILEKYATAFKDFYSSDKNYIILYDFHQFSSYILPCLNLITKNLLWSLSKNDIKKVAALSAEYIKEQLLKIKHFSYKSSLYNTIESLQQTCYPQKKSSFNVTSPQKTDSDNYNFNQAISRCYFMCNPFKGWEACLVKNTEVNRNISKSVIPRYDFINWHTSFQNQYDIFYNTYKGLDFLQGFHLLNSYGITY